jgi:membrane-anchored protein YejM (alkaline phosphatase superfamily)
MKIIGNFFHLMTVSNHRPYTYPNGKFDIPSGDGRNGAVRYSDYALQTFIENSKHKLWLNYTVFVVIADHAASSAGKIGLPIEKYHIPFLIYSPKHIKPQVVDKVVSQIDLAPTLLALLNLDYTSNFFGEDVLSSNYNPRALIGNYQKLGLFKDSELIILSPQKVIEQIRNPYGANKINTSARGASGNAGGGAVAYYQSANYFLKNHLNRW